jgi:hypothetical protein
MLVNMGDRRLFAVLRITLRVGETAAQSRIRKELVACLRYDLLVWTSTRTASRWQSPSRTEKFRPLGMIPNRLESIRKLVVKLGGAREIVAPRRQHFPLLPTVLANHVDRLDTL